MNARIDTERVANAVLLPGEAEEPLSAWTLAELELCADLDSVCSARAYTDSTTLQGAGW